MLKGIVFDFDGTLVDSYDLHERCWLETFQKFGLDSDESNILKHFGKSHIDMVHSLAPGINAGLAIDIALAEQELFKKLRKGLHLFPSVLDILSKVKLKGIECAIASSNPRSDTTELVKDLGIASFVSKIVGADEVKEGKPNPALIILAAQRLSINSNEGLVVGDTVYDILAGARAGMRTVLIVGKKMTHGLSNFPLEASANYLIPNLKYLSNVLDME